jgi:hypothetical protein
MASVNTLYVSSHVNIAMLRRGLITTTILAQAIARPTRYIRRLITRRNVIAIRDGYSYYIDLLSVEVYYRTCRNTIVLQQLSELRRQIQQYLLSRDTKCY